MALFVVILILYLLTILGNTTIILIFHLEPKLHTPMYFFLSHLSFLDLCFTSSVTPQLLVNLQDPMKTITYGGCMVQLYISLALGSTECELLAVKSYDHYVAICRPLHYALLMHPHLCMALTSLAWLSGVATTLVQSTLTLQLPLCGHHQVDHFICEVPVLIKLACVDTTFNEAELFVASILFLVVHISFILVSYGYITQAVLKIKYWKKESLWDLFFPCDSCHHVLWNHHVHVSAVSQKYIQRSRKVCLSLLHSGDPHA